MQTEQQDIMTQDDTFPDTSDAAITDIWGQLSPHHRQLTLQVMHSFLALDLQRKGAIALLDAREAEFQAMSPEERAQAEQELEEFKASMNANRAPLPPLYP